MSQRIDRVDELLRQEIGAILEREVSDPRIGFVTVTRVEASPDLAHARVWVSIIGTQAEREESLRALGHAMPYVRRQLGGRIRIKRIPALYVHMDESIERGARVLELIDKVAAGTAGDPLAPTADEGTTESLPTPTRRRAQEGDAADEPEAETGIQPGAEPTTGATDRPTKKPKTGPTGRATGKETRKATSRGRSTPRRRS